MLYAGAAALLLGACALGGKTTAAPAVFDLGPALAAERTQAPLVDLQLTEMSAPPWLATPGIAYRLVYLNEFQAQFYRDSRWLAPPAALLSERLRQKVAQGGRNAAGRTVALRLELVEFEQRFSSPTQSEVRVSLRARLGEGAGLTQVFELVKPSPSADAAGAVRAFSEASDQLLTQVLTWTALNGKP
ncbi:ABC-type transport auxiliary lipoprotein family protein [Roseateles oligotrophus]|uniref:ABC-type transport auxiliary lipoprotein family protein n=1 Tax=Roseateles oligotrophus TaxID=1769250 RepID=A0ABT2YAY9_9BURK|nr:ABC-type transport auxiliary lipoprotein family protein [Roseateles oligotrophus]MCV2367463.1 ABC-type transport auxiliary lipoprotein family protein [Roseateles oligotrophus]